MSKLAIKSTSIHYNLNLKQITTGILIYHVLAIGCRKNLKSMENISSSILEGGDKCDKRKSHKPPHLEAPLNWMGNPKHQNHAFRISPPQPGSSPGLELSSGRRARAARGNGVDMTAGVAARVPSKEC
jgi:hypothetical protein